MRNVAQYPAKADETIEALARYSGKLLAQDISEGRMGNMTPYLLNQAAKFIEANTEQFEKFCADNT